MTDRSTQPTDVAMIVLVAVAVIACVGGIVSLIFKAIGL